jgi:hypothetical protein
MTGKWERPKHKRSRCAVNFGGGKTDDNYECGRLAAWVIYHEGIPIIGVCHDHRWIAKAATDPEDSPL